MSDKLERVEAALRDLLADKVEIANRLQSALEENSNLKIELGNTQEQLKKANVELTTGPTVRFRQERDACYKRLLEEVQWRKDLQTVSEQLQKNLNNVQTRLESVEIDLSTARSRNKEQGRWGQLTDDDILALRDLREARERDGQ